MLHKEEEIVLFKKFKKTLKNKNQNHPHVSLGHQIHMLFQTFLLADFRLMYIIQAAACTAVEKKQNDMLIDHLCQDFLLILNALGFFSPFS